MSPSERSVAPPPKTADLMRRDWDLRAAENALFFIASGASASEEAFRSSGRSDLEGAVLDGIELSPEAEALEIGCGVGRLLVPLSERIRAVHGVDISEVMIEKSRSFCAGHGITTATTDGTLRDFRDGSLDFVFSFIVFQHIPEWAPIRRYVEEAARVLRPGGLFRFQVDGRWRRRELRAATTYDGVKLSPAEVRELLSGTGLVILDEWGSETHYHWITAQLVSETPTARVACRPRAWDEAVLRDLLARAGRWFPKRTAARIMKGSESLRRALDPLERLFHRGSHEEFVRKIYRALFASDPEPASLATHVGLLERKVEFREDILDILLMGAELRELVRPFILPEAPWYRIEGLRALLCPPSATEAGELLDLTERCLESLDPSRAVGLACQAILGCRPTRTFEALYTPLLRTKPGRSSLARRLLGSPPPRPVPGPPPPERVAALAVRLCLPIPEDAPRLGGSFPGEGLLARRLLAESSGLDDPDFLRVAYEKILGRPADEDGERYWALKLAAGEMNRPGLLRELFWSEELRRPWPQAG